MGLSWLSVELVPAGTLAGGWSAGRTMLGSRALSARPATTTWDSPTPLACVIDDPAMLSALHATLAIAMQQTRTIRGVIA
jgi:hypothetical protein